MTVSQEKLLKTRVRVFGDVMLDRYGFCAVDRISSEAPVHIVCITRDEGMALLDARGVTQHEELFA